MDLFGASLKVDAKHQHSIQNKTKYSELDSYLPMDIHMVMWKFLLIIAVIFKQQVISTTWL